MFQSTLGYIAAGCVCITTDGKKLKTVHVHRLDEGIVFMTAYEHSAVGLTSPGIASTRVSASLRSAWICCSMSATSVSFSLRFKNNFSTRRASLPFLWDVNVFVSLVCGKVFGYRMFVV